MSGITRVLSYQPFKHIVFQHIVRCKKIYLRGLISPWSIFS